MKNFVFLLVFSLLLPVSSPLIANQDEDREESTPASLGPGINERLSPKGGSNPDDWGEGEVIVGGDAKAERRAKKRGKQLAKWDKEDAEREREKERQKKAEEDRIKKKIAQLEEDLKKKGWDKDGWRVRHKQGQEPYLQGPMGQVLPAPGDPEPETDPDDWGQKEKIL